MGRRGRPAALLLATAVPLSKMTLLGRLSVKRLTCSTVSSRVWPSHGLQGLERMPTAKPSLSAVVRQIARVQKQNELPR